MSDFQTVILRLSKEDATYLDHMVETGGYENASDLIRSLIAYTREEEAAEADTSSEDDSDEAHGEVNYLEHLDQLEQLFPYLGVPEGIGENGDPMWRKDQWKAALEAYEKARKP